MSKQGSRVIKKEALKSCEPWNANSVAGKNERPQVSSPLTARQLEEVQKQAYDEAFAKGLEEGLAAGERQMQERAARMDQLLTALNTPFEELDQQVEDELVSLSIAIVRQLIRREIRTDPGQVVAVVREAVAALPVVARKIRLHLHPDDASLVREAMSLAESKENWQIVGDPVLSRGGCRVVTENSQVDATLETRLSHIIASVFGGERANDEHSVDE